MMRALYLRHKKEDLDSAKEIDLITAATNNPSAFEPLYNKYFKQIYLFLLKRCANESLAEDLSSQTFLKALKNLHQYNYQGVPFSAWLYRIAHNELLLHYRQQKSTRAVHAKLVDVDILFDEIAEEENKQDRLAQMKFALAHLSEKELQLVEMKYFEHRPYAEISEIMDISVANVKVRIHRIMKKLQKLVK